MEHDVKLRILVDNRDYLDLATEHGFAVVIETAEQTILFDTGQLGALQNNAKALGYDLNKIDKLVLSHGHFDHTGNIAEILTANCSLDVYAHPQVFVTRYSLHPEKAPRPIGMSLSQQQAMKNLPAAQLILSEQEQQLLPGIGLSGVIPRLHPLEDTGGPFFFDPEGERVDPIEDDQSIWFQTEKGLVILTGCCHSGLINTVQQIQKVSGETKIRGIIGGLHLHSATKVRLDATVEALRQWQPEFVIPCHCSGDEASDFLFQQLGDCVTQGHVGMEIVIAH